MASSSYVATAPSGKPIARIKESLVCCPNESVTIDGWASIDPGGEVVQWQWDLGSDGNVDRITQAGEVKILTPRQPRTYPIVLRVVDNEGNISEPDTALVCVMQGSPQVRMASDTVIKLGSRFFFRPMVYAPCSPVERYEWDFDNDGIYEYSSRESGSTSRPFYRAGRYLARLKVTDSNGREGGGVMVINVVASLFLQKEERKESEKASDTDSTTLIW